MKRKITVVGLVAGPWPRPSRRPPPMRSTAASFPANRTSGHVVVDGFKEAIPGSDEHCRRVLVVGRHPDGDGRRWRRRRRGPGHLART